MRGISHETLRKGYTMKTSALTTPLANEFYSYVKKLHDGEDRDLIPTDIVTLRRWFYQYKEMEQWPLKILLIKLEIMDGQMM